MFKSCLAAQNNSNEPAEENLLWLISGIGPTSSFELVTPESLTAVLRKAEWPDFSKLCRRSVRSSRSSFCFSSRTMASHSCSFLLASPSAGAAQAAGGRRPGGRRLVVLRRQGGGAGLVRSALARERRPGALWSPFSP